MDHYEVLLSIYAISIFPDVVTRLILEDMRMGSEDRKSSSVRQLKRCKFVTNSSVN